MSEFDYGDSLDTYMERWGAPDRAATRYHRTLKPTFRQLRSWTRQGPSNIASIMLDRALSSEAGGVRAANQQVNEMTQSAFGTNPTPLNASLAQQANLASRRPMIEAQTQAAGVDLVGGIGQMLANLMGGMPGYVTGMGQPYFSDAELALAEEAMFPPTPESDSGGGCPLGI